MSVVPVRSLVSVYTWAKSLDDKSAAAGVGSTNAFAGHMNENHQSLDYERSDFDVSQRFVRVAFQFRAEAFNVFNHAQYGYDPNTATSIGAPVDHNPNDKAYGKVIAARPGRIIQLGGKIIF